MINTHDINKHNIGDIEVSVKEIFTEYFDVKIKINHIDLDKYLKALNYKPVIGFEHVKEYMKLVPMRRITTKREDRYVIIAITTKPIEFSLAGYKQYGTFRYIASSPDYCVNSRGIVYNLVTNKFINSHDDIYRTVPIYGTTTMLHRLVALAWCENDDYVEKYVVDHINQDKTNTYYKNLDWKTQRSNVSRSHANNKGVAIDHRWLVYSSKLNTVLKFTGLKEIERQLGIPYRNIEARTRPFIHQLPNKDVIIVEDAHDFKGWNLKNKIHTFGYRYKTINKNIGETRYFRLLEDVLKAYGLKECHFNAMKTGDTFNPIRNTLLRKKINLINISNIKIYNAYSDDKYDIELKNIKTNEVLTFKSTAKAGEHFVIGKGIFIYRLNGNIREGLPYIDKDNNQWLVRKSTEEWPKVIMPKKVIKKIEVYKDEKIVKTFDSQRAVSRYLSIPRTRVGTMLINNVCEENVCLKYAS